MVKMRFYFREIEQKLKPWINRPEIVVIKGPRQSGKTTLLKHLQEELGGEYFTLEDPALLFQLEKDPKGFWNLYKDLPFLFLDEAQYLSNIGRVLKLWYDLSPGRPKIFVTGSGNFDSRVKVTGYLVGRAVSFTLYPLNFYEWVVWKSSLLRANVLEDLEKRRKELREWLKSGGEVKTGKLVYERELLSLFEEFLVYGGFPQIVLESFPDFKKELLHNLVSSYLERDIGFFFRARKLIAFLGLARALSVMVGDLVSVASLGKELKLDSRTIEHYLELLELSYVGFRISPYFRNPLSELRKTPKFYFVDAGMRNALSEMFLPWEIREDKGKLVEGYVARVLFEESEGRVRFWRTKQKKEVDFVWAGEEVLPIEVKLQKKVSSGMIEFLKRYSSKRALVLSLEPEIGMEKIRGAQVLYYPVWLM